MDKVRELVLAAHDFSHRARCLNEIVFVVQRGAEDFQAELDRLAAPRLPQVRVRLGDITQVASQGLVTAINSEGMWGGGVDRAIQAVAGGQFHRLAQVLLGQPDLQADSGLSPGSVRNPENGVSGYLAHLGELLTNGSRWGH